MKDFNLQKDLRGEQTLLPGCLYSVDYINNQSGDFGACSPHFSTTNKSKQKIYCVFSCKDGNYQVLQALGDQIFYALGV